MEPKIYHRNSLPISLGNIDQDVIKILYRLNRSGFKGYLVGGSVRDLLLRKQPKDFDLATDARPEQIRKLFRNSRLIGRRFKLVHIYFHGNRIIEVATFRGPESTIIEESTAGEELADRQPETLADDNTYGDEESDAFRRDLTINALFFDPSRFTVIDYVSGMDDLIAARVRVIGDPRERFYEDPVRMLRAVRHAARAGFDLDPNCREAILELYPLLDKVPPSRLYDELAKDLTSGALSELLPLLIDTNLACSLAPGLIAAQHELTVKTSPLLSALRSLDAFVSGKEQGGLEFEYSVADALALILLAILNPSLALDRLAEIFPDPPATEALLKTELQKVPIPRREREKVSALISSTARAFDIQRSGGDLSKILPRLRLSQAQRLLNLIAADCELKLAVDRSLQEENFSGPQRKPRYRRRRRSRSR